MTEGVSAALPAPHHRMTQLAGRREASIFDHRDNGVAGQFECGRQIFALATWPLSSQSANMAENHPFIIKIEEDPQSERRFRWSIYEGDTRRDQSSQSYATIRHAKADAERVMQRLITTWRSDK
jgi:hypothetical protein